MAALNALLAAGGQEDVLWLMNSAFRNRHSVEQVRAPRRGGNAAAALRRAPRTCRCRWQTSRASFPLKTTWPPRGCVPVHPAPPRGHTRVRPAQLVSAALALVKRAVFHSADIVSLEAATELVPTKVDPRLRALLGKVCALRRTTQGTRQRRAAPQVLMARLPTWRAAAAAGGISPPRLVSADWRVDVKASSDGVQRTAEPTVLLNLQLQRNADVAGHMPGTDTVTSELSQAALATLLAGLHQIRDQLAAAAR